MIVIGGSASTGSSLCARILNRHSNIICGPETSLFARPQLIKSWAEHKHLLTGKHLSKLKNPGWHRYYGTFLNHKFYGLTTAVIKKYAKEAQTFGEFVDLIKTEIIARKGKDIWVEKTPANVYSIDLLKKLNYPVKTILTIRNPYDTITSLTRRGFSVPYATAYYLMNTSFGYKRDDRDQLILRYEDLVREPDPTVNRLCEFIGADFEEEMIRADNRKVSMSGWQLDETGQISSSSLGSYDRLAESRRIEIASCVDQIMISDRYKMDGITWSFKSIKEICTSLNYPYFFPDMKNSYRSSIKKELFKEKIIRTIFNYPSDVFNFPIEIKKHERQRGL